MRKSKYTEAQIVGMLREHEQGRKVADICREHGVSQPTFYQWKSKYGGMQASELKELRALKEENTKLKLNLADTILDRDILKEILGKKPYSPTRSATWHMSLYRRASRVFGGSVTSAAEPKRVPIHAKGKG